MSEVSTYEKPYYGLMDLMKRSGITQEKMSKELEMDRATFNVKINRTNGRDFTFTEAMKISKVLSEPAENFF